MSIKGKTAIITGGSRGIGAATALKLASMGADVAIIYAGNAELAEAVRSECEGFNVRAYAYRCNVADYNETKETVDRIKADLGTVNILVNNAGITRDKLLAMMKEEAFDSVIATNLKGAFNMIRHCTGIFIRNKGGNIVNVSSVVGIHGNAGQCNYSASKAGIIGLTKSAAKELAGKGIICNAIAPGFIETDMTKDLDAESNPLINSIPLKRAGKKEEVAEAIAFLAGQDYITGQVLGIDGGLGM